MRFSLSRMLFVLLCLPILIVVSPRADALADGRMAMFDASISPDGRKVAFSWMGDIWTADVDTGRCARVTDHVAEDWHPVWFPDGGRIVFASNRDGNDDVYSVPVSGGTPTRHTRFGNYDIPVDISPDGKTILFRSYRRLFSSDLFEVDVAGGSDRPITHDTGINRESCYSSDGGRIVVCRGSSNWQRRKYNGSGDTDIYVMDRNGRNMRWVENGYNGIDYWPCWGPGDQTIYFVSDRDGMENVYRIPSTGGPAEKLTDFTDRPVLFLSVADTGRVAFIQDFRLWIMDPGQQPRRIHLDCSSEPKHSQDVRLDISGNVEEIELSPLGTHIALIARGELYVAPVYDPDETPPLGDERFRESVRVTDTPSRERHVAWHPDGDRVALISDRDGNQEVYEIDLRTYEWTRLTNTPEEEYLPVYSPDGTRIAYYRANDKLVVRDLETGSERVILHTLLQTSPWPSGYNWSPDSRWIAYTGLDSVYDDDVFVVGTDENADPQPVNITVHHDTDYFAGWTLDGKSVYMLSSRDIAYGLPGWGWWQNGYALYVIQLNRIPAPRSDVLEFPEEKSAGEETETAEGSVENKTEEKVAVEINFDRIDERARLVTSTRGGGWRAALSPDSKTFVYDSNALGTTALWSIPFDGGSANHIADAPDGLDDLEWLPDGSGVYYLTDGRVKFWKKDSIDVSSVPAYGRLTLNLADERSQMIQETGRVLENHFYDPLLHGTNWDEAIEFYEPLVEQAAVPEEFTDLMSMLFGELDASHLSCWTSGSNEGIGETNGYPGLDFDPFAEGPGLRVTKVYPRGPADYSETRIEPGEWVLEINGEPVSNSDDYWRLFDDSIARTTVLKVASDQEGTSAREVTLAPVPWWDEDPNKLSYWEVQYFDWVDSNRAVVEKASDGRVGYVHISGMSGEQLELFAKELFAENFDKEALIIDVRFNGGGNTHEQLMDILSRPQFAWQKPRDAEMVPQPPRRWDRPTVVLINERSFSDAEIFPAGFRALGLGTIIGETTFGGVIGTWNIALVDGVTYIRVPQNGWLTMEGQNMENLGIQPDIRVADDLNHIRDGIDDQLNAAVEFLMERLKPVG